jgi:hypothetical protein
VVVSMGWVVIGSALQPDAKIIRKAETSEKSDFLFHSDIMQEFIRLLDLNVKIQLFCFISTPLYEYRKDKYGNKWDRVKKN